MNTIDILINAPKKKKLRFLGGVVLESGKQYSNMDGMLLERRTVYKCIGIIAVSC